MEKYTSKLTRKQLENRLILLENKLSLFVIEADIDEFNYFACNVNDTKAIFNYILNTNEFEKIKIIRLYDSNDMGKFITIFIDNNIFDSYILRGHFYSTFDEPKPVATNIFHVEIIYDYDREIITISHI